MLNAYLLAEDRIRKKLLLEAYFNVHKHAASYSRFNDTSYAVLGRNPAADGGRNIHLGSRDLTSLTRIIPTTGEHFVNIEHAKLALADSFAEFAGIYDAEITEQIVAVQATFTKMVTPGLDGDRLRASLRTEDVSRPFFDGLVILVDSISQKYYVITYPLIKKLH